MQSSSPPPSIPLHNQHNTSLPRVPHLDGLRAIAIIAVLLYHFEFPPFSAGFLGVDIFFSISGFIITLNIAHQLRSPSTFSITKFYTRRFFRLYPASAVTVLCTLLALIPFFAPELSQVISSRAVASLTLWSNVFSHLHQGYFDVYHQASPLLHFWSLSVEEQFYLIWPLLILLSCLSARPQHALNRLLAVLFVLSFGCAAVTHHRYPSWTFYELPSRIFQFAAGAILAINASRLPQLTPFSASPSLSASYGSVGKVERSTSLESPQKVTSSRASNILATLSLFILLFSFVLVPTSPSPFLLLPLLCATTVLLALPHAEPAHTLLSCGPFVALGRRSYALYLVHWPIRVYGYWVANMLSISPPRILLLVLSFPTALVLFEGVEQPLRYPRSYRTRVIAVAVSVLALCTAILFAASGGFAMRFPEDGHTGWAAGQTPFKLSDVCKDISHRYVHQHKNVFSCQFGPDDAPPSRFVFAGDSYTKKLGVALELIANRRHERIEMHYSLHCGLRSLEDSRKQSALRGGYDCVSSSQTLWPRVVGGAVNGSARTVVVSNLWLRPTGFADVLQELGAELRRKKASGFAVVSEPPGCDYEECQSYYACAMFSVLPVGRVWQWISGGFRGAKGCLAERTVGNLAVGRPDRRVTAGRRGYAEALQRGILSELGGFVDLFGKVCGKEGTGERCLLPMHQGKVVYDVGYGMDMIHLSSVGSAFFAGTIEEALWGHSSSVVM